MGNKNNRLIDSEEIEIYAYKEFKKRGINLDINTINIFADVFFDYLVQLNIIEEDIENTNEEIPSIDNVDKGILEAVKELSIKIKGE